MARRPLNLIKNTIKIHHPGTTSSRGSNLAIFSPMKLGYEMGEALGKMGILR